MKYLVYTIILFVICLLQTSIFAGLKIFFPYINIVYIALFSYYIGRKSKLSLYLFFIAGVFLDLLTLTQVGVTSANFFISLLVYVLLTRLFPEEQLLNILPILAASGVFSIFTFLTKNFLMGAGGHGFISVIPIAIVNAIGITLVSRIILHFFPEKKGSKIKID